MPVWVSAEALFCCSGRPCADAKPSLLLQEVEKNNLTHQLLCKLCRSEVVLLGFDSEVFNSLKLLTQLMELLAVKVEELVSNLFDAERILKIIQSGMLRICSTVGNETLKLTDSSMTWLVLTYEIGVSRRNPLL